MLINAEKIIKFDSPYLGPSSRVTSTDVKMNGQRLLKTGNITVKYPSLDNNICFDFYKLRNWHNVVTMIRCKMSSLDVFIYRNITAGELVNTFIMSQFFLWWEQLRPSFLAVSKFIIQYYWLYLLYCVLDLQNLFIY